MASYHPTRCRVCGIDRDRAHISKRGLCLPCGERAMLDANRQLSLRRGPVVDKQVANWLTALGQYGRPITDYPPDA